MKNLLISLLTAIVCDMANAQTFPRSETIGVAGEKSIDILRI